MGYITKSGKDIKHDEYERTVRLRQKMLDFFKREDGATFTDMHQSLGKKESVEKFNYHFYELKNNGYIEMVGLKRIPGKRAHRLWKAIKDVYTYDQALKENIEFYDENVMNPKPVHINGVTMVRMRHTTRRVNRAGKVNIGSSFAYFD